MRRRTLLQSLRTDISTAVVTASSQTYNGSAHTPTPTVTLNGVTLTTDDYDVAYSNNTNAGTATITITGKGDYTGTASGTFTISRKGLTITAKNQTITYGQSISQSTSQVTVSGLVSGDSLTGVKLSQSTTNATQSGTITPTGFSTSKGSGNYSVTYYTGTLVINRASGSISFQISAILAAYDAGTTEALVITAPNSGWEKTTEKTVSGYQVFKSFSNYHVESSVSVMKLTFANTTGKAIPMTVKVGKAMESSFDFPYIANWDAADITSSTVPSSVIHTSKDITAEWTDVDITIPTGTHTLQIVYRKDGSVDHIPDCGYFAMPMDVRFTTIQANKPVYAGSGSITYSSSNTSVATVNSSTGVVTIKGTGTATITATMAANTNYTGASASYTITVSATQPNIVDMDDLTSASTFTAGMLMQIDGKIYRCKTDTSAPPFPFIFQGTSAVTQVVSGTTCYVVQNQTLNSDWEVYVS